MTTTFDFGDDKNKMLKAAENPNTSSDMLRLLAKSRSQKIKLAVANNINSSWETLEFIFKKSSDSDILNALAANKNTPIRILIELAESGYWKAFYNPNMPFETIEVFAEKNNYGAMSALARHPQTSFETLKLFAKKGNHCAISALMDNNKTPVELLESIIKKYQDSHLASFLAKNSNVSTKTLMFLKKIYINNFDVRISLANNKNTTSEILDSLIYKSSGKKYKSGKLCLALANHPNASAELLEFLSKSKDVEIVKAVANNLSTPEYLRLILDNQSSEDDDKSDFLGLQCLDFSYPCIYLDLEIYKKENLLFYNLTEDDRLVRFDIRSFEYDCNYYGEPPDTIDSLDDFYYLIPVFFEINPISKSSIKQMVEKGKIQGYLTYAEINEHLPGDFVDLGDMEEIINMIDDIGIRIYEFTPEYIQSPIQTAKKSISQPATFRIPPPPEPLQFNTTRISEIQTESKKVSSMLNAIYEQDETAPVARNSSPQTIQPILNLDSAHLEIVKILVTRSEWERDEVQEIMKGMMIDGVLEHINDAFFDYCEEAFIEDGDPIEINVELYKEIFK